MRLTVGESLAVTAIMKRGAFCANIRIGEAYRGGDNGEIGLGPARAVATEVPLVRYSFASILHSMN